MFLFRSTINQNIVEVRGIELIEVFTKGVVNKSLKRSGGYRQPERYNEGFEESEAGKEGGKVLVAFLYPYVIKRRDNINLYKVFYLFEVV